MLPLPTSIKPHGSHNENNEDQRISHQFSDTRSQQVRARRLAESNKQTCENCSREASNPSQNHDNETPRCKLGTDIRIDSVNGSHQDACCGRQATADRHAQNTDRENVNPLKGRQIELVQRHKAESDMAVAAASVLARAEFLAALNDLQKKFGFPIPKGASTQAQDAAVKLIEKNKPEILLDVAKCHFKTADVVLEKMSLDRSALGPEGQATSKTMKK